MKITVNGVDLDINLLDANVAETFESAVNEALRSLNHTDKVRNNGDMTLSKAIREAHKAVASFFDTVFGDGTAERLFADRVDFGEFMTAFAEVTVNATREGNEKVMNMMAKYTPNREARRK